MANCELGFDFRAPKTLALRKSYCGEPQSEQKESYRSEFMRDRDRIMYCRSFRRLGGKTQIYRAGENDHQRNRLTHTLEVAQLSRTIASALNLDCDLAEAIALGHDLGHAPFGHAGEEVLHKIMTPSEDNPIEKSPLKIKETETIDEKLDDNLGFKHNIQSVRIITEIDNSYEKEINNNYVNCGLDLTNFTLWGIMHHSGLAYAEKDGKCTYKKAHEEVMALSKGDRSEKNCEAWSFEAFVVKQADEIAQWHHDLEDALRGNAMRSADVYNTIKSALGYKLKSNKKERERFEKLEKREYVDQIYLTEISHVVIEILITWLIDSTKKNLNCLKSKYFEDNKDMCEVIKQHSWDEVINQLSHENKKIHIHEAIGFRLLWIENGEQDGENNDAVDALESEFRNQIHKKIHHSQDVERMNAKGRFIIERLFASYYESPQQLPNSILIRYMLDYGKDGEGKKIYETRRQRRC